MIQPLLPPGFIYQSELGSGGTARVVSVTRENHKRAIALKIPLPDSDHHDQTFVKLAQREWQLIGGLTHPGLVRLLEVSSKPEEYIIMEICQGPTLDTIGHIKNHESATNIFSALALNLEFLRIQGIIHGDLKPHNYFLPSDWQSVAPTDRLFFTKLSDFSLGKLSSEPDAERLGLGTVGYMAPETISDKITSFKTDLFALGVIAYQMYTGIHPFMENETDPVKINSRCQEDTPASINEYNPEVDERIAKLIDRLLAKNPENRPESGWEVCQKLEAVCATYPFKKGLRPSACLNKNLPYKEQINTLLDIDSDDIERLNTISNTSNNTLRLILSHNIDKGNLVYNNRKFSFKGNILWPNILRNQVLDKYSQHSITEKKNIIKCAISGSIENCAKLDLIKENEVDSSLTGSILLLRQFISLSTYKRLSPLYATVARGKERYDIAADMHLQSGDLSNATEYAYQAATILHSEHKSTEALKIISRVIDYAHSSGKLFEINHLLMLQGDIHKDLGEIESALSTYKDLISLYKNNEPDKILAETYKDLGDLYKVKHQFDRGIESLSLALEIYYLLDDELEISHTLNNIGNIYWIDSDTNRALLNYRKALKIQRRLNASDDTASTLNNIGSIYALKGKFKRGIEIFNLSLKLKKEIGNKVEIARTLNNLGYCYQCCGNQYKAVNALTESLELNRQVGNKKEILYNLENLTALMITAGQLKESLKYLKEGIAIADSVGDKNHFGIFQLSMATVLRRMGQYGQAENTLIAVEGIVNNSDDKNLKIMLKNARASIRLAIGDNNVAENIIIEAIALADEVDNRPEKLNSLLLITKINNDSEGYKNAQDLAGELSLKRENILLKNNLLGLNLSNDYETKPQNLVDEIEASLNNMSEDVEVSGIYLNLAEYYLNENDHVVNGQCKKLLSQI